VRGSIGKESFFDYAGDAVAVFEADDSIEWACLIEQQFAESLREAASDDDLSHPALSFSFDGVMYRGHRFGFCGSDEGTGVDDDDVCVVSILCDDEAGLGDLREHSFAVDHIFGTTEGDEANGNLFSVLPGIHWRIKLAEKHRQV
jgi:hypothetical protein